MSADEDEMPDKGEDKTLADRLRSARASIQRRETRARADRRASARRVERGDPESLTERARVTSRRASEATDEIKGLGSDAVDLLSTELGTSRSDAKGIIESGADALDSATEAGGNALDQFDIDGDGDTDILTAVEEGGFDQGNRDGPRQPRRSASDASEPPVGGVEDDVRPLDGIEEELGLEGPIEEDFEDRL